MMPLTEKVLQRLVYEGLLALEGISPRRVRVTLVEVLEAGKEEPKVYEVLPAMLLHKPKIIYRLHRDLPHHPRLRIDTKWLREVKKNFFGIPSEICLRAAETYGRLLKQKRQKQKSLTMNLRLAPTDVQILRDISRSMGLHNASETIRRLIREKAVQFHVGEF